ncbi:MAG: sodium:proton antiporter [Desulfosporosinus sp.]|nr:sodium:proton antiporter [Desulfosporosinus sp.]
MENYAIENANQILVNFSIIFVTGAIFAKLADYIKVPDVVLYLLAGILLGPQVFNLISIPVNSTINQLVLTLGASVLLFHGGLGVSFGTLRKVWITLLLLSTVGVLLMVAIVGLTAHFVLGISLFYAFLLAAILAPTDPAALVPIFLSVKVRERLAQTVLSESAFNDATASIVTFAILGVITSGKLSLSGSLLKLIIMAGGGILVGALYGLLAGYLISDKTHDIFSVDAQVLMFPVIIASYMTAEHFGASGFMAVFVAGLIFGNLDEIGWAVKESAQKEVQSFIHIASLLLRITIFVLLGSNVNFSILLQYFWQGLIIVGVFMFIARPIVVLLCTYPDKIARWERREILFMFWTRETGVIPAALAGLLITMKIGNAEMISSITFLAVFATLSIQATTTRFVARRLNLLDAVSQNTLDETLRR